MQGALGAVQGGGWRKGTAGALGWTRLAPGMSVSKTKELGML